MTQPLAGLTENAPAKEQNPLPEGPEEKEEGRRRGSLLNWAIGLTAVAIAGVSVYRNSDQRHTQNRGRGSLLCLNRAEP